MQELEKILEEINDRFENLTIADDEYRKTALSKHNYEQVKYFQNAMFYTERAKCIVEEIIHKHMGNDGWIPVEERMPEESLNSVIGWDEERKRCCFVQRWGGRWIFGNDIDSVKITAWRPLPEPYRPERSRN